MPPTRNAGSPPVPMAIVAATTVVVASAATAQDRARPTQTSDPGWANVASECAEAIPLPEPAGPHQIGTAVYAWIDPGREEVATPDPHDLRQVVAQIFYPAIRPVGRPPVAYMPELAEFRLGFATDRREVPQRLSRHFARYGCVLTHAWAGAPVSDLEAEYPVVLFSPGGNMSRHWHTAQAQELASHGYVVAVLGHAYSGMDVFPVGGWMMSHPRWDPEDANPAERARLDEELTNLLAGDARFALDRLSDLDAGGMAAKADSSGSAETSSAAAAVPVDRVDAGDPAPDLAGRLALERVAILGHSRGGSTVSRACSTDARFDACAIYDNIGPDRERSAGLRQPQLAMRRPWPEERVAELHRYLRANSRVAWDVVLDDAGHNSFSDLPLVDPEDWGTEIDARRAHRMVSDVTLAFLGRYLPGDAGRRTGPSLLDRREDLPAGLGVRRFGPPDTGGRGARERRERNVSRAAPAEVFPAAHRLADSLGTVAWMLWKDDRLLDSYGAVDHRYRLHSVRKSLLGTLFGIAVAEGRADTARTLAELGIDDWGGLTAAERRATVRHLLQSRSGVYLSATHENRGYDRVRPARGSRAPGEDWFYSNWDFNAAGTAYQEMTGQNLFGAFAREIARPIGMEDFRVEDGSWRYGTRSWHPAYVFRMSARDLLRFGRLVLQRGRWEGRRIVSAEWIDEISRPHSRMRKPDGAFMPGVGYGLLWIVYADDGGPLADEGFDLGPGVIEASGTGVQLLLVAPARDLVFVYRTDTDVKSDEYRGASAHEARRVLRRALEARGR